MDSIVGPAEMVGQIMDLGMTVVAAGDTVVGSSGHDLVELELAVGMAGLGKSRLQKTASSSAAVIVRFIRDHIDEVLFTDKRFDDKAQIIRHLIAVTLSHNLAGVLNGKFNFQVLVPFGIHFQSSFTYPFGVILINGCYLELMVDIEFFQSGPD